MDNEVVRQKLLAKGLAEEEITQYITTKTDYQKLRAKGVSEEEIAQYYETKKNATETPRPTPKTSSTPNLYETTGSKYTPLIDKYATEYGVNSALLHRQMRQESANNPNAVSSAGARGLTQFMPETAKQYGVIFGDTAEAIESQVRGQAKYMADLKKEFNGDKVLATFAYNQGPGNVRKYLAGGTHKTTAGRDYVKRILGITMPVDGSKYGE